MSLMRVLITGGTGLLGKSLLEQRRAGAEVTATFHARPPAAEWQASFVRLDVRDADSVARLFSAVKPQAVIHAASVGSVDEAQRDPSNARAVNVAGTAAVIEQCRRHGARLVFVSSNAVFDGERPPYAEGDPVRAINRYGELKIAAERLVQESALRWTIVRPILLYGWPWPQGRGNAVTRWVARLEARAPLEAARDIISMPLAAPSCAEAIWRAVELGCEGIYHLAGRDRVTLEQFARAAARAFGCDEALVRGVASRDMAGFAPRPRDTSFATARMERALGVAPPPLDAGLRAMRRARQPSAQAVG